MSDRKSRLEAPRAFFDLGERQQLIRDLTAMREVLRRQGWVQDMGGVPGGPRCLRGSIYEVVDGMDTGDMARARVARVVAALGFATQVELVSFNDASGRTKEQVLARIDAARARAEAGHKH